MIPGVKIVHMSSFNSTGDRCIVRTLIATLIPLSLLMWLSLPVIAADSDSVRLGIEAVDSDLAYFDISLEPGESRALTVRFSNHGEIGTGASVFAADVYSLHGGGMGMADIDAPRTGVTEWIDLESAELELEPGESVEQVFTVAVPEDTQPGDYVTAVVIQNTDPIDINGDDQRFDQTVRQGIAVAIDVPGDRAPAMEFGEVRHSVVGGNSVVEVDLVNTGNTHVLPSGNFAMKDATGNELASSPIGLDTVFAGTSTVIEVTFTDELPAGDYLIRVEVEDAETEASAAVDDLALSIAAAEATPEPDDGLAAAVETAEQTLADNRGMTAIIVGALFLIVLLVLAAFVILVRNRRDAAPEYAPPPSSQSSPHAPAAPASTPSPERRGPRPSIRQLTPPERNPSPDSK